MGISVTVRKSLAAMILAEVRKACGVVPRCFLEKSVKMTAADVEVVCDICHCDIQKRTFFDVIHSLGDVKIIVGFHGGVGSMKFFLQHGDDSVKTALDISFVGRCQLGMGHISQIVSA